MHILITDLLGNRTDFVRGGAAALAAHSNPYGLQIMMPALACISAEQPAQMALAESADMCKPRQSELMHVLHFHVLKDILKGMVLRRRRHRMRMFNDTAELNDQAAAACADKRQNRAVHGILFIEGAKEPLEAIMSVHNRMVSKGAIFHAFQKATVSEPVVKAISLGVTVQRKCNYSR